jgi:pilus assembly protein Flp/PilA
MKIFSILRSLHNDESGQDLIEYALVAALIAFGATASMSALSTTINGAFSVISTKLVSALPGA